MKSTNLKTENSFALFLIGATLAVALGLTFALSTPALAGGGGGGGGGGAPAAKIDKIDDPAAESEDEVVVRPSRSAPVRSASAARGSDNIIVGFENATSQWNEGDGGGALKVLLDKPFDSSFAIHVSVDFINGVDFSVVRSTTFSEGQTYAYLPVSVVDDDIPEQDEEFTITLLDKTECVSSRCKLPEGVSFGIRSHTVTVPANDQDKEIPGTNDGEDTVETPNVEDPDPVEEVASAVIGFDGTTNQVTEGKDVTLRITLSESLEQSLTLPLYESSTDRFLTAEDFSLPRTITIPSGTVSKDVTISTVDDEKIEEDETFTISISEDDLPDFVTIGNGSVAITISDDDKNKIPEVVTEVPEQVKSVVEFTTSNSTTAEEHSKLTYITAHVNPPSSEEIRLLYDFDGSAKKTRSEYSSKNKDYHLIWSNPVIPPYATSVNVVQFMVFDDDIDEGDETITVALNDALFPEGVDLGERDTHTVTITDDDDENADFTVGFVEPSSVFHEDVGSVALEVALSEPWTSDEPLTVYYWKSRKENKESENPQVNVWHDEHDQSIDMYWHNTSVTFHKGDTSKTLLFDIADDRLMDYAEVGVYTLSGNLPENVKFGIKSHIFYFVDNDYVGVMNDHRDGLYEKKYDGTDILLINSEEVVKIEALHSNSNRDADIRIENTGTVLTDIVARNRTISRGGSISIENYANGLVNGNVIGKHHSEGNIDIENHGIIGGDVRAIHFNQGDIDIRNYGRIGKDVEVTHYGTGVIRYDGDINRKLRIVGNYEGSDDRQLKFHVHPDGDYARMRVEGNVTGQSRVSLVVDENAVIGKDTHFEDLIKVAEGYDAEANSFVGEQQIIGAFNYVLEHEDEYGHAWSFVNKGLSDTAEQSAKIPDETKDGIETPPIIDPDKKQELSLWGGLDSSHTDIGLGLPAFVSNDDYYVGSQVQYYLKEDRTGIRALVETEYDFDIMNFRITPHARLTWTRVGFEGFIGPNRERISLVDGDTVDLGVGISFDNEYQISNGLVRIYGGANLLSPLDGETSVRVSGFTIVNEQDDLSVDGRLGASYEWGDGYAVRGEVSTLRDDDAEEIRANLGLDVDF